MCWEGKAKDKKIAKRNIPVKKLLSTHHTSPYMGFRYVSGKQYREELYPHSLWNDDTRISLNNGLHCYSKKCITKEIHHDGERYICVFPPLLSSIGNFFKNVFFGKSIGFCLFPYSERRHILVTGFIPVGSVYYENKDGEIVSEGLVLKIPKEK